MANEMKIKVTAVSVKSAKTKGGKDYEFLDLDYRNLSFDDKAEAKKIMPFGSKEVFATLKNSSNGDVFTVLREKDDAGYWQWIGIASGDVQIERASSGATAAPAKAATPAPKSTFETPEERAKKQIYIVRQSSISAAIDTLKTDKKSPTVEEVLAVAKQYEQFVFGTGALAATEKLPEVDESDDVPY
jgi:hypothetical protein